MRSWAIVLLLLGAALSNLPPGPVPLLVLVFGGLLWSVALTVFAVDSSAGSAETAPIRRMRRG